MESRDIIRRVEQKVMTFVSSRRLIPEGSRVLVACSGGPDSLALLDLLVNIRRAGRFSVAAAHFEHGIRGQDSVEDAAFVASCCRKYEIDFFLESMDVPLYAERNHLSLELAARVLRYRFLFRLAGKTSLVATAHHMDDQAETVLMRIFRGTGTEGLRGIQPADRNIIHPFLCLTKKEIEEYCLARGLSPRFDETNNAMDATRNRIRHIILPILTKENPSLVHSLSSLSEIAAAESAYMDDVLSAVWNTIYSEREGAFLLSSFRKLPLALQRRAIRAFWSQEAMREDLGFSHVEILRTFFLKGKNGREDLPQHFTAVLSYGKLTIRGDRTEGCQESASDAVVPVVDEVTEFYGYRLTMKHHPSSATDISDEDSLSFWMDGDVALPRLFLRFRRSGDYMAIGTSLHPQKKKVKKIFIDARVPSEERGCYPLLATDEEVLWIPGIRRSTRYPVRKDGSMIDFHLEKIE